jgi:predicted transcriptional regulator
MTVELPAGVEKELRDLAEVRSREVPELVEEAIRQYLEAESITDVSAADVAEAQIRMTGELRDISEWKGDAGETRRDLVG